MNGTIEKMDSEPGRVYGVQSGIYADNLYEIGRMTQQQFNDITDACEHMGMENIRPEWMPWDRIEFC